MVLLFFCPINKNLNISGCYWKFNGIISSKTLSTVKRNPTLYASYISAASLSQVIDVMRDCWNCKHKNPITSVSCVKCSKLQELQPSINYFRLFGLPTRFDIDSAKLDASYKALQRRLHPDRFTNSSSFEKAASANNSSLVNKANEMLRNPLNRASYMLQMEGLSPCEENNTIAITPELMAEIFEVREAISETSNRETLDRIERETREKLQKVEIETKKLLGDSSWKAAQQTVMTWKYLLKILEEIDAKRGE